MLLLTLLMIATHAAAFAQVWTSARLSAVSKAHSTWDMCSKLSNITPKRWHSLGSQSNAEPHSARRGIPSGDQHQAAATALRHFVVLFKCALLILWWYFNISYCNRCSLETWMSMRKGLGRTSKLESFSSTMRSRTTMPKD